MSVLNLDRFMKRKSVKIFEKIDLTCLWMLIILHLNPSMYWIQNKNQFEDFFFQSAFYTKNTPNLHINQLLLVLNLWGNAWWQAPV